MKEVYVTKIFNAVLGQFCAEVITLAFARIQKALFNRDVKKLLNKLHQGAITVIMVFAVIALKLEKGLPNFFKFQSICMIAIRCIRRQETVSIPKFSVKKQNWTIIFGIQLMNDARESFNFLKR